MQLRGVALLLVIGTVACGSKPPPPKAAPPAMKKEPSFEADAGGKHLVVRFADSSTFGDKHAAPRIVSIEFDGNTLYPRDCAAKSKTKLLACSPAHRGVKDVDFHLIAKRATDAAIDLVIAGRASNNLECGALDYWLLRVDKNGANATEPATGCFTIPSLDPDAQNPVVEWGPPLTLRTFDEKSAPTALVNLGAYWKVTKSKKP